MSADDFSEYITLLVLAVIFAVGASIGYHVGASEEAKSYRKEAVKRNFATWVVDADDKVEFQWKGGAEKE